MSGEERNESEKSVNDSGFKRFAFEHGVTWFPEDPIDLDAVQETDKPKSTILKRPDAVQETVKARPAILKRLAMSVRGAEL